jgi:rSAM/selenodomain-associated transferase 2
MQLSVIVPTLNEENHIAPLLRLLRAMPQVHEIIVCDGGSDDATVRVAEQGGARVVNSARNRGAQLNAGAGAARGDTFWFLHADARPHPNSARLMQRVLGDRRVWGGNFRLRFDRAPEPNVNAAAPNLRRAARLFESIARWQRPLGIYYGDSGVWVRRAVYETLGGFQAWPLFEDFDFARRLERRARRHKARTVCLPLPLRVSSRRFRHGAGRVLWQWACLQTLFSLGVSPHRLARLYHR